VSFPQVVGASVLNSTPAAGDSSPGGDAMIATAEVELVGDGVVVIRARGEFDLATSQTLARALEDASASGCDMVLDLAKAAFLDVYCLKLVLRTQEQLSAAGHTAVVVNAPPVVQRLVSVLHLDDLIAV
jgi:anti-anti-sigma factor